MADKAEVSKPKRKTGRPSTFTQELANLICDYLSDGMSLRGVCRKKGMPAKITVLRWLNDNETFCAQYTRAREAGADAVADDIQEISDRLLLGKLDPNAARVALDAKKWSASKLKPKKYGDRIDVTTNGENINRGMTDEQLNAILARAGTAADQTSQSPEA